jgi:putative tricarboxylic transport membrane protein
VTEGNGLITEKQRRPDRAALAIAAGMVVLAVIIFVDMQRIGAVASYARIGPQTVPLIIAMCLAVLGIWTAIEGWRGDFPAREPQGLRPVLWIVGGLVAQIILLRIAGFSIATGVLFGCVAYGLGRKPLWFAIPLGILLSLAVWVMFAQGLSLNLPAGPIESAIRTMLQGSAP